MTRPLFTVVACSLVLNTCAPVNKPADQRPLRQTVVLEYAPEIGRVIIPSRYNGRVRICIADGFNLNALYCKALIDLRRDWQQDRYAERVWIAPERGEGER